MADRAKAAKAKAVATGEKGPHYGQAVVFNGGEGQEHAFGLITEPNVGNGNQIVLWKRVGEGGWEVAVDVPRRARADYGPEGGGHTWHYRGE